MSFEVLMVIGLFEKNPGMLKILDLIENQMKAC